MFPGISMPLILGLDKHLTLSSLLKSNGSSTDFERLMSFGKKPMLTDLKIILKVRKKKHPLTSRR